MDYTDTTEEQEPVYTAYDLKEPSSSKEGEYSIVKSVAELATPNQDVPKKINFDLFVHDQWSKTVAGNNALDIEAIHAASRDNNQPYVEQLINAVRDRNQLLGQQTYDNILQTRLKLKELTTTAVDNVINSTPRIWINNPPDKIAVASENIATNVAAQASLEKQLEDGRKSIFSGLLFELTPFAAEQGAAMDRVGIKYGVPSELVNRFTGRSETRARLQSVFRSLPDNKKVEWATNLYNDLKDSVFISEYQAAYVVSQVTSSEEVKWDKLDDWLDRLGAAGAIAASLFAIGKSINLFKISHGIKNTQRTIAQTGGKDAIATAEAVKIANVASARAKIAGTGVIVGELTGVNAAIDLTKLVSMSASKILPESVSIATSKMADAIKQPVQKLVNELQDTVSLGGIRGEEAATMLQQLKAIYDPSINPNIFDVSDWKLSSDGLKFTSTVLYKPANSSNFLTKEAAEAYIKSVDPQNIKGMKVVPDTTNTKFLVEESVIKDLETQRTNLTAELFNAAKPVTDVAESTTSTSKVVKLPWVETLTKAIENLGDDFISFGNVSLQYGTHQRLLQPFTENMGNLLGMNDRKIVVMQMSSLLKSKNESLKNVAKLVNSKYINSDAVHFPVSRDTSVIVMRHDPVRGGKTNLRRYMETFAHEYGHAFEAQFSRTYAPILMSSFNKWLRGKNIKWKGNEGIGRVIEALPFEAMLEYRNLTNASDLIKYIDDWFSGNKTAYLNSEKELRRWTSLYSEFFAEQFSKWAFSDTVATDALGEIFVSLVNGFKEIARQVIAQLKQLSNGEIDLTLEADKNIAAMLRKHVELVKENKVQADYNLSSVVSESKSTGRSVEAITKDLEAIEEELRAYKAAKEGLTSGWLVEHNVSELLGYSKIGTYTKEDIASAARFHFGDWALSNSEELYIGRNVGIHKYSRFTKLMTNFVRPQLEALNKQELSALSDILVLGDKEGKVFSQIELSGYELSAKTQAAYYRVRALRDIMHGIRNDEAAKSLARRGYVDITSPLVSKISAKFFGKEVTPVTNNVVYEVDVNKATRASQEYLSGASKKGLVFYESVEPILIDGKYYKTFAFNRSTMQTKTPAEVLPYRVGEYRRIYSDEYFVKIKSNIEVDGKPSQVVKTHRTAASVREANEYVNAFEQAVALHKAGKLTLAEASKLMEAFGWKPEDFIKQLDDGVYGSDFRISVNYNRLDEDYVNEAIGLSQNINASRGDRVLSVRGDDTVNTINPIDSIAAEISNTAYVASTNEWREAHIIRWFNTFKDDLPIHVRDMSPEDAFIEMYRRPEYFDLHKNNRRLMVAGKHIDYIMSQLRIPSKEEKKYIGFMRAISEDFEGKTGSKKIEHVGMLLRTTRDYPTFMRTVAFNSFFAFNPLQFFMQGMNSFNAMAISPIHGLKAAKTSSFYALALFSDQPEIWAEIAKMNKLTSFGLDISNDEFVEVVRAIRRSGLLDGINTTSLYGAETGKLGIFNKWTRRLRTAAATPFNSGEGLSRLVSFDIARREFKAKNPGVAWWLDENMALIMKRQDDLTQNMTTANRASWQSGWKSIPTQFIQYQVKVITNVLQSITGNKRTFTRPEALRLLLIHGAVMGTSGMMISPFREFTAEMLEGFSEEVNLYIQQGIISGMIGSFTDGEVRLALGSRFNTFRFYEDLLKGIFDPEKSFLEVLGGPSGFAATRIVTGGVRGIELMVTGPMTLETLKVGLEEIARNSLSSFNNVYKAQLARNNYNQIISSSGKPLYTVSDGELFALALGIPPAKQEDYNIRYESKKIYNDDMRTAAKEIAWRARLALTALNTNNDVATYNVHYAAIQVLLNNYQGPDRAKLMQYMFTLPDMTEYQKLIIDQMVNNYQIKDKLVEE